MNSFHQVLAKSGRINDIGKTVIQTFQIFFVRNMIQYGNNRNGCINFIRFKKLDNLIIVIPGEFQIDNNGRDFFQTLMNNLTPLFFGVRQNNMKIFGEQPFVIIVILKSFLNPFFFLLFYRVTRKEETFRFLLSVDDRYIYVVRKLIPD